MTHGPLWAAVQAQADAWSCLDVVRSFAMQLPRNSPQQQTGIPGILQEITAGGGPVSTHPLRIASTMPMWRQIPGIDVAALGQDFTTWLDQAHRVEQAHRHTIAWLRSRLPGYPMLSAPQLAPGTPLTTLEFTTRLSWTPHERGQGLQFMPAPAGAGPALQAATQQQRRLDETARVLVLALEQTSEWQRFVAATPLPTDAKAVLLATRAQLALPLLAASVIAAAGDHAVARAKYRAQVLSDAVTPLSGAAREYTQAFEGVNAVIETAASDIFGQLLAYGAPITISRPQELDVRPGPPRTVEIALSNVAWPDLGAVVWIDDPLVDDAVHLIGMAMSYEPVDGTHHRLTGVVLEGTAESWARTALAP